MSRGIEANFECGYATCSGDPESEGQSLGSPDRPCELNDFDSGSFLAVSQITKTVSN
jgi:hypothetical protein